MEEKEEEEAEEEERATQRHATYPDIEEAIQSNVSGH